MFIYEKKLEYPVKIANPNPKLASIVISQYGGPNGELGASLRYLSQRFSMPYPELKGLLTDIGTEESVQLGYQQGGRPRGTGTTYDLLRGRGKGGRESGVQHQLKAVRGAALPDTAFLCVDDLFEDAFEHIVFGLCVR